MEELYLKSIQRIKETKVRTKEEYAKLAKKEGLLIAETIEYLSNIKFEELAQS